MIDLKAFGDRLGVIGLQLNQPVSAETIKAYWAALCDETSPEEWAEFARTATKLWAWTFLPSVPMLMDALREYRGALPLLAEAVQAYERVLEAGEYTAEAGRVWSYRAVSEACGAAAAEAFMVAGGHNAFASSWKESDRRERFLAAYAAAVRDDPSAQLLPAGPEQKALTSGEQEPTREEAAKVIERLQDLAGVEPAPPKALVVVRTKERDEFLRRQARAIQEGLVLEKA